MSINVEMMVDIGCWYAMSHTNMVMMKMMLTRGSMKLFRGHRVRLYNICIIALLCVSLYILSSIC